tara:strand:- start:36 stop:332 length:297 start_codon:yes stop_codon:yes gene_type:complete
MSIELHETVMGRRLIEHTLPKIGNALEKIAKGMEKPKEKEWYVVFAALFDPDKPGRTIDQTAMFETLKEAKEYYEPRRNLKNCHSAGIARLMEGTDWV